MPLLHLISVLAAAAPNAAPAFKIVQNWNAYEVPPSKKPPTPAGKVTNVSTLAGCTAHCQSVPSCVQFAWNYGSSSSHRWYCEISSALKWTGTPSNHITSGCLPSVKGCGMRPPPPPPGPPPPPPGRFTPRWTATVPDKAKNSTFGYPLLAPTKAVHSYVYHASSAYGTYNHGPMVSFWGGVYWMEWYNGIAKEGVENRVLYATSKDAVTWTKPAVMFNTTGATGLENEPYVSFGAGAGSRRYSVAGSWDVFARHGGGAEHTGPDTPLMRRVHAPGQLGPVFWLGKAVPTGYERFGYPVYDQMDAATKADAAAYVAALVGQEPLSDWGKPNERTLYELPANRRRLMALLRSGGQLAGQPTVGSKMLASTCVLGGAEPQPQPQPQSQPQPENYHVCRPGTGLFNAGLPGDRMPPCADSAAGTTAGNGPWPGYHPVPVGRHCNWTQPVATSIPDSHSRACAAPLPDGRIFLIGAQIPKGRDPIVLSISQDGLDFSEVWAVRHCAEKACEPRYGGPPGFQYPAAMWMLDGPRGPEILFSYSVNKEDIGLTRFPLSVLDTKPKAGLHEAVTGHKTDDESHYDDFHYPLEEPKEMASVTAPTACVAADGWSVVFDGAALCVLERSFKQWGLMALLDPSKRTSVRMLRKSIGELQGIAQPRRNFTAEYIKKSVSSLGDYPSELALNMKNSVGFADSELSFGALAQQLAPPRDITEISLGSDVVKFVVSHSGRIKCAGPTDITEVQNLSTPLPGQKVVFDPSTVLSKATWPAFDFDNQKSGLLGGHQRIANFGAYSAAGGGFELIALADASFLVGEEAEEVEAAEEVEVEEVEEVAVACNFSAAKNNTYITGCPGGGSAGCKGFALLALAEAACQDAKDCGGVTFYPNDKKPGTGMYQLRGCGPTGASGIRERSYLKEKCASGRNECMLPRLPNINYSPAVYVRVREQVPGDIQESGAAPLTPASFRYYRVGNSSAPVNVSASEFYANLGALLSHTDLTFDSVAASLRLPGAEGRRQRDQALSGLLLASNNYVGNQANYGDGLPYWSVARQDNGSLALIPTTVDDALLDFGLCDTALAHIGFWLDNYLNADGQINYFTWGGVVDGVGDIGRVASLYLKARRQCASHDFMGEWAKQHEPALLALGRRMLVLKAAGTDGRPASAQRGPRRPECEGLVAGCPEADWSHFAVDHSPDNETWYSVNLWLQRGMEEIGGFLPPGDTLGAQLRGNNSLFKAQLTASVAASVVPANSSGFAHPLLLPPFARKRGEFAVFKNMTTDVRAPIEVHDLASYSNFRFLAEMLLADTLPREIETALLAWHNSMGGRLAGASRFMDHLDDFPSSAWAYAALTNNQTADFHALLYGHMATYSSRGTFHATEQLQIESDGDAYRHYSPTYKGDVSLCVPTAVEVARLTRWQLVFEPYRSDSGHKQVWLARGAPKRWFRDAGGFGFGDAERSVPLASGGTIAFQVSTTTATQSATFNVTLHGDQALVNDGTRFVLRWPGALQRHSAVGGCTVVASEPSNGLVVVVPTWSGAGPAATASFSVNGRWKTDDEVVSN